MINLNHYEMEDEEENTEPSLEMREAKYKEAYLYTCSYFTDEELLDTMQYIADYETDLERGHIVADTILCEMLRRKGCEDFVHAWQQVAKWYS